MAFFHIKLERHDVIHASAIPSFFRGAKCNWRLALRSDDYRRTSPEARVRSSELPGKRSRHAGCGTLGARRSPLKRAKRPRNLAVLKMRGFLNARPSAWLLGRGARRGAVRFEVGSRRKTPGSFQLRWSAKDGPSAHIDSIDNARLKSGAAAPPGTVRRRLSLSPWVCIHPMIVHPWLYNLNRDLAMGANVIICDKYGELGPRGERRTR